VRGDADDLRTLLRNLVDNAVRYTGAGGRVDVSVEEEEEEAGGARAARLTVSDDGPGIPPEERERVFDRFHRRAVPAPPGSGLGLSIVKSIADAHGATLTLASGASGKGLSVTVSFRQDAPAEPQALAAH